MTKAATRAALKKRVMWEPQDKFALKGWELLTAQKFAAEMQERLEQVALECAAEALDILVEEGKGVFTAYLNFDAVEPSSSPMEIVVELPSLSDGGSENMALTFNLEELVAKTISDQALRDDEDFAIRGNLEKMAKKFRELADLLQKASDE